MNGEIVSINSASRFFFVSRLLPSGRGLALGLSLSVALVSGLTSRASAQSPPSQSPSSPDAATADGQSAPSTNSAPSQQSQPGAGSSQPAGPTPASSDKGSAQPDPIKSTAQEQSSQSGTSKDRLFFALPNFLTLENAGQVPPLTAKQKFAVVARGSFDYVQYPWYGFLSGISQWEDSEPGFGQGAEGYGKRYGAAFADGTIENFFTGAIIPSILRQDPRYFQLGQGSIMHRTLYAMSRNLITRTDSGKNQFSYSEVVGGALAAAISTYTYHPKSHVFPTPNPPYYRFVASDRTFKNTLSVWGTQYGYDTLTLVIKEFWPDIRRKLKRQPKMGMLQQNAQN